jgi:hypothetical protein
MATNEMVLESTADLIARRGTTNMQVNICFAPSMVVASFMYNYKLSRISPLQMTLTLMCNERDPFFD